jgi:hypothetical protein
MKLIETKMKIAGSLNDCDTIYEHRKSWKIYDDLYRTLIKFMVEHLLKCYSTIFKQEHQNDVNHKAHIRRLCNIKMNDCWHLYGTSSDEYICMKFRKILSYRIIKSLGCLISLIHKIQKKIIDELDLETIKKNAGEMNTRKFESYVRKTIIPITNNILNKLKRIDLNLTCKVDANCHSYDGRDYYLNILGNRTTTLPIDELQYYNIAI